MIQRNENEIPTLSERMVFGIIVVFFIGFLFGIAAHDRIFTQNPEHAVWKSFFLSK
jgi:hypothetical protein